VVWAGDINVAHHEIDIYDPKGKDKTPGYTPEEGFHSAACLLEAM